MEIQGADGSALTPLPTGGSYGHQVSRKVACPHWIYAMEAVPDGNVKVGSTHRPAARYRTHKKQVAYRSPGLALACRGIWSLGCMKRGEAARYEYEIHGALRRHLGLPQSRNASEWYEAPIGEVLSVIGSYINHLDDSSLMGLA